ncbi:ImmA/IrrE family metallo-endopeptidase [Sphingobium sp. CCH11-B1]|uniref:ImmA/IrrE family metallo-endopeptidase n=1 Tax=Sphingobium sp. CCH11-B1 TaxID=1768781 RepID=UPI00082E800E|nr:ImmA/IrrE family metallo-endopeptidase [Sphingobium sp. CCH11-B1]
MGLALAPGIRDVLKRHQQTAPVKVGALAADLGLTVLKSDLPAGISGMLLRDPKDSQKWIIRVNRQEARNRQRFTIAHEIAHFLLHRDEIGGELTDDTFYRSGLSERREWEANKLAADILMPWDLVRSLTDQRKLTPKELAGELEVSEAAMQIRLGLPT